MSPAGRKRGLSRRSRGDGLQLQLLESSQHGWGNHESHVWRVGRLTRGFWIALAMTREPSTICTFTRHVVMFMAMVRAAHVAFAPRHLRREAAPLSLHRRLRLLADACAHGVACAVDAASLAAELDAVRVVAQVVGRLWMVVLLGVGLLLVLIVLGERRPLAEAVAHAIASAILVLVHTAMLDAVRHVAQSVGRQGIAVVQGRG